MTRIVYLPHWPSLPPPRLLLVHVDMGHLFRQMCQHSLYEGLRDNMGIFFRNGRKVKLNSVMISELCLEFLLNN